MGREDLVIALCGNANVGKSALFNQLTGLRQTTGNWPGKTVEIKEGILYYRGKYIKVVDLPGIYSLSTYSPEEEVAEEYILKNKPDVVINVIDAAHLERNLFFTIQLLELGVPLVVALNQVDFAESEGVFVDVLKLQRLLSIPVVPTVAIKGKGLKTLIDEAIKQSEKKRITTIEFGKEVESRINELVGYLPENIYPSKRFIAIKLLEGKELENVADEAKEKAKDLALSLEKIHGEPISFIFTSERYSKAEFIARETTELKRPEKKIREFLDSIFVSPISGYIALLIIFLLIFGTVYQFGSFIGGILENFFTSLREPFLALNLPYKEFLWNGIIEGFLGSIYVVIPYILPFYFILGVLEDSGYLARMAFLTDSAMHLIGLHGKASLPLFLGFGCNVPAVLGSRIIESKRERELTCFLSTLVPCSARTIIIMGLVGAFIGFKWALILYFISLFIIFAIGKIAQLVYKSDSPGLIMEIPSIRAPSLKMVIKSAYFKLKDFVVYAIPLIVAGNALLEILNEANWLTPVENFFAPLFNDFLGLPSFSVIPLIFGILRKELGLIMLAAFSGTANFSSVLLPRQMIVYSIIILFYFPCVATIAALFKELGLRKMVFIVLFEIIFAISIGALANVILKIFML